MSRMTGSGIVTACIALVGCLVGCGGPADPPGGGAPPSPPTPAPAAKKPFLDQQKQVPPRKEWTREVGSRAGGPLAFRVTAPGPVSVTVITDKGFQAVQGKQKVNREDVLLTLDADGPTVERTVTVPAGASWFIIGNRTDQEAAIRLECFAP